MDRYKSLEEMRAALGSRHLTIAEAGALHALGSLDLGGEKAQLPVSECAYCGTSASDELGQCRACGAREGG